MKESYFLVSGNGTVEMPAPDTNFNTWNVALYKPDGFNVFESIYLGTGIRVRYLALFSKYSNAFNLTHVKVFSKNTGEDKLIGFYFTQKYNET